MAKFETTRGAFGLPGVNPNRDPEVKKLADQMVTLAEVVTDLSSELTVTRELAMELERKNADLENRVSQLERKQG